MVTQWGLSHKERGRGLGSYAGVVGMEILRHSLLSWCLAWSLGPHRGACKDLTKDSQGEGTKAAQNVFNIATLRQPQKQQQEWPLYTTLWAPLSLMLESVAELGTERGSGVLDYLREMSRGQPETMSKIGGKRKENCPALHPSFFRSRALDFPGEDLP